MMGTVPESKLEFDPGDLQFVTPSDRAKALPLSGEILFLAVNKDTDKDTTRVLGFRSAENHRYVVLAQPGESSESTSTQSTRWTVQNVSTVPLPSDQPETLQDVLSAHRVGAEQSFHFSDLGPMSATRFNQRFGHTDLNSGRAKWGETQP